jgi:lipoate-protein ligase B
VIGHVDLGRAEYGETLALQRAVHAKRCAGEIGDIILSVEHRPVLTLGRSGSRRHILVPPETLQAQGIEVFEVERGGGITYHGPGQLVVYPILDLRSFGKDVHRFVWILEEAILRTLAAYEIDATRRSGFPGVWVGARKMASLGIYVKHWVSYHGIALNVAVNPEHFRLINPCGLSVETVSINDLATIPVELHDVRGTMIDALTHLFDSEIVPMRREELI